MAPSLSHSLLLQSRWQLDRKRNRKGLKDLLLLSFSFKDKRPSDNFPQCSLHGGLCDQWLWESTGIWPTTTSTMGRRRRSKKKNRGRSSFFFYKPTSRGLVALLLWEASGFIYPSPGILEDPCALSGCRVWACSRVAPYCCCEREELKPAD